MEEALDELREELNGERLDLAELVILGAREKLGRVRGRRRSDDRALRRLGDAIRNGELPPIDPEVAAEARRGRVFE